MIVSFPSQGKGQFRSPEREKEYVAVCQLIVVLHHEGRSAIGACLPYT
jgi:hypothetical protein